MTAERQPAHISTETGRILKNLPVPHPETLRLFTASFETGVFFRLNENERKLVQRYYLTPGFRLRDINPQAGSGLKEKVLSILDILYQNLPEEKRENIDKKKAVRLKHQSYSSSHIERIKQGPATETRRKLSETAKRVGFPPGFEEKRLKSIIGKKRSKETRAKISQGVKAYRETQKIDLNLWKSAIEENLIGRILNQNYLTKEEIDEIKGYLEGGKSPPETLMEKFSIAVARTA